MKRLVLTLIYSIILRNILKVFVGVSFKNKDNLKKAKQYIIVANHNSHLDSVSLLSALNSKQLINTHPIAAGDYFGKSPFKASLTRFFVNAILIPRSRPKEGEKGIDPIELMLNALDRGESIILFPEGSRGEPEKFQKFKKGIGIILEHRPLIPYIPVFMKNLGKVLPKGDPVPVPFNSFVIFGEPTYAISKSADEIVIEIEKSIKKLAESN